MDILEFRHKSETVGIPTALYHLITQAKEEIMATIEQAVTDLTTAVTDAASRVSTDLANLNSEIATLKASGVDTAGVQAAADSIEANVTALNAIDPAPVTAAVAATPSAPVAAPAGSPGMNQQTDTPAVVGHTVVEASDNPDTTTTPA